jgi:ABC-2 type transport system ATP-binding protein
MQTGIRVQGLKKTYRRGRVKALDGLDVVFAPNRIHGLIGPNGSGKTTLMGCMLGLLHRDAGEIDIDGMTPDSLLFKATLGYVPERLRFDMWMTAWDFMVYHDRLLKHPSAGRDERLTACLDRIGIEKDAWQARLKTYSRGMLQRIGLAQALLGQPQYLFLDEPTSGMDPNGVILFKKVVREENARGCTVVLSSHQLSHVEQLCTEIHYIEKGRLTKAETQGPDHSRRVLRLRWVLGASTPDGDNLPSIPNATLVESNVGEAFYEVNGDAGAQTAIKAVLDAGFPIIEAVPDTSRLERLFDRKGASHD